MAGSWVLTPRPNPRAAVRLFCFPYAGGGTTVFRSWPEHLSSVAEVCLVELPGRGARLRETPFRRLRPLVETMGRELREHLSRPYVFFGHSMGAVLAYELARLQRRMNGMLPRAIIAAGHVAPHIPDRKDPIYGLPDAELVEELKRLNGTPAEVFKHPELLELLLPILRADLEVNETYVCSEEPPLPCPIIVFGGLKDIHVSLEDLDAWRTHTTGSFERKMLDGDHFFIHTAQQALLHALRSRLANVR